ncbi:MAG: hypothetical protein WCT40_03210 [Candidatus Magasanikbacteria bacterium]|jgi:hypothetical protein
MTIDRHTPSPNELASKHEIEQSETAKPLSAHEASQNLPEITGEFPLLSADIAPRNETPAERDERLTIEMADKVNGGMYANFLSENKALLDSTKHFPYKNTSTKKEVSQNLDWSVEHCARNGLKLSTARPKLENKLNELCANPRNELSPTDKEAILKLFQTEAEKADCAFEAGRLFAQERIAQAIKVVEDEFVDAADRARVINFLRDNVFVEPYAQTKEITPQFETNENDKDNAKWDEATIERTPALAKIIGQADKLPRWLIEVMRLHADIKLFGASLMLVNNSEEKPEKRFDIFLRSARNLRLLANEDSHQIDDELLENKAEATEDGGFGNFKLKIFQKKKDHAGKTIGLAHSSIPPLDDDFLAKAFATARLIANNHFMPGKRADSENLAFHYLQNRKPGSIYEFKLSDPQDEQTAVDFTDQIIAANKKHSPTAIDRINEAALAGQPLQPRTAKEAIELARAMQDAAKQVIAEARRTVAETTQTNNQAVAELSDQLDRAKSEKSFLSQQLEKERAKNTRDAKESEIQIASAQEGAAQLRAERDRAQLALAELEKSIRSTIQAAREKADAQRGMLGVNNAAKAKTLDIALEDILKLITEKQ